MSEITYFEKFDALLTCLKALGYDTTNISVDKAITILRRIKEEVNNEGNE